MAMTLIALGFAAWALWRSGAAEPPAAVPPPAAPPPKQPSNPEHPVAERIGPQQYRLGKVTVDIARREARCPGEINMSAGALEYLSVTPTGKRHESLLSLDVKPLHLQTALLLMGLEVRGGLRYQGDTQVPQGDAVTLTIEWTQDGKRRQVRAGEWVEDVRTGKPLPAGAWVFSGSRVTEAGFAADAEGSLIGIYRDPVAILNNRLPSGADDTVYQAFLGVVPPVGTPVTLIIRASGAK